MRNASSISGISTVILFTCVLAAPARAQVDSKTSTTAPPQSTSAPATHGGAVAAPADGATAPQRAEPDEGIGDIVVTAQKREQKLQDVPISLQVVSGDALIKQNVTTINNLQERIPNLIVQETPGNKNIFIRGFGSSSNNFSFDNSVSLYLDGVYAGRARQFNPPLFDLERVEVFRGPQGALLGKNTAAGAISVVTRNPTDHAEFGLDALYNVDRAGYDLYGYASGPVADGLGLRVAAKYTHLDGFVANSATGANDPRPRNFSGRATLRFDRITDFDATLKVQVDRLREYGAALVGVPANAAPTYNSNAINPFGTPIVDRQNDENASLTMNLHAGDHTITSVTGYEHFTGYKASSAGFTSTEPLLSLFQEGFHQYSQELRLTSPAGNLVDYITGIYYDHSDYDLGTPIQYNIRNLLIGQQRGAYHQIASTYSAFAQGTFNFTGHIHLLGSLRYTNNVKSGSYNLALLSGLPLAAPRTIPQQRLNEAFLDPSVTLQYRFTPDVMVYATYGRGSKGGGFVSNTRTVTPSSFKYIAERSTNYEGGIKSQFLNRHVTVNLTGYVTKFRNLQVSSYDSVAATFVTNNAASATSKGFEGTIEIVPVAGFRLSSSAAYTDAKYDNFLGAQCPASAPATCVSATNNLKGYQLLGSSKWSGTAQADYETVVADRFRAELTGSVQFRSSYPIATDYSPVYGFQGAYQKVDATLEFGTRDRRYTIAVIGKNLTNKLTQNYDYLYTLLVPSVVVHTLQESRTVSVQGRIRF